MVLAHELAAALGRLGFLRDPSLKRRSSYMPPQICVRLFFTRVCGGSFSCCRSSALTGSPSLVPFFFFPLPAGHRPEL